jgi:restriction system protein
MARKNEDFFDVSTELPWWVSVVLAAVAFVGLRFIVPAFMHDASLERLFKSASPFVGVIFLMAAGASAALSFRKRRLLDKQRGIETIRELSWKRFEELIGEAFRRQGYSVVENIGAGADGGIDLRLRRDGNLYLVQCKRWRDYKVGVRVVREMLGLVTAHGAQGAIIVTTGLFTQEARTFAASVPVDLVEGQALVEMIGSVQRRPPPSVHDLAQSGLEPAGETPMRCPSCGSELVVREARRGSHAGSKFWGCSTFPRCRYTEAYEV